MLLSQASSQGAATSRPLSVSEAMQAAKRSLESITVKLIGEVSEVNAKAGYKAVYFTVKDAGASLPCMIWLNRYHQSGVQLCVGQRVELTGRFTLYAPKGRMNFDVFSISLAGEGDLRRRVAELLKGSSTKGLWRLLENVPSDRCTSTSSCDLAARCGRARCARGPFVVVFPSPEYRLRVLPSKVPRPRRASCSESMRA